LRLSISSSAGRLGLQEAHLALSRIEGGPSMQYALLIYQQESVLGPDQGSPALNEIVAKHMAFSRELGPTRVGGSGLKSTASATTVRRQAGVVSIHDGPFAETREQLGGFYLIEAADLDAAIAVAEKVPLASDGAIEIRPMLGGA
jgi:hypothetical protein